MKRRALAWLLILCMVFSSMPLNVFASTSEDVNGNAEQQIVQIDEDTANVAVEPVAKVGNTEYATIDEAISNWTNGTTLTLLSDVTLSDVIKLSSTEHHILDLGTYTMTAAKNKDAIQYVVNGRTSMGAALTINADAENPGGITATGKSIISHIKPKSNAPSKDRPQTIFNGGVFNASYVVKQGGTGLLLPGSGYTGASAPGFIFNGGTFNGTIYTNRSLNQFYGGTFNGSLSMSVDTSAYTQVAGGTFKNLSNIMNSELNSDKFVIGTSKGANNGSVCIDENGYYVVTTTTPTNAEASVASNYEPNNYFYYSTVNTNGMYYEDVYDALEGNKTATVTVYAEELDLTGSSFTGTIVVPEGKTLTITNAPEGLKTEGNVKIVKPVAKIGDVNYASLAEAVAAVQEGETITILEGTLEEGTVKLPTALKNVTFKGEEGAILKNTKVMSADGNGYSYIGVSFDNIKFDNSKILISGWRNGESVVKDFTVKNCYFENVNDTTSEAAVHFNMAETEAVENFTFINNEINGATGGSKSGIYLQATGEVVIENNVINNVAFRPFVIQITTDDGTEDEFIVTGNTFSGTAAGRIQGLGNNDKGTDAVNVVVNNNIFKDITASQQICYWNFNAETTSVDLNDNFYSIDIKENPSKIYFNSAAKDEDDLIDKGLATYYTNLSEDGTFDEASKVTLEHSVAQIGEVKYKDLYAAMVAAKSGETVKLIADVDLAGTEWEPVSFKGKFDGQNYTISNLTINKPGVSNTGFITSLNSTFENVTFVNPTVTGGECTGVVAGTSGGGAALAKNITVTGTIKVETTHSGYARAGVIVGGWAYGNYEDITVDGIDKADSYIKHTGGGDGRYVAGIVGHADDVKSYINCEVKNITISGEWLCGGIAGPGPASGLASGCSVENVDVNADYSGGMFGWYFGSGTIENSSVKDVTFTAGSTRNGAIGGYGDNPSAKVENVVFENVGNKDGKPLLEHYAAIGNVYYTSVEDAFKAAQAGDEVKILKAGEYKLPSGKNITITGAVAGVVFKNIGAHAMGGADVTFNNVTFEYANDSTYNGLQHSGNLVYNNCTFNGQIFLYGESETFNNCTFNQTDKENYNVWTYTAKEVAFNECTFNSAGKSVLVYAEDKNLFNDVTVTECAFNASEAVEGKAAIEMDSSLTAGINLTIDGATTATGFGTGNVSGNSLWNNKKGNNTDANNDITVFVGTETVLSPVTFVAQVGSNKYANLKEAFEKAEDGATVKLLADFATNESITVTKTVTLDLNGKTIAGTDNATGSFGLINVNPGAKLTVVDATNEGKITLTATNDRDWNAYSAVISNQRGTVVIEGGTIEHLGGTDMAYGIDNLTNGKGTKAELIVNGGTIKSTYRAIRQFLNGVEAENTLTINGGTIEGANKSVWVQSANKSANPGAITVGASAKLVGDVYLYAAAGATEWPVSVHIAEVAVAEGSHVLTGNLPNCMTVDAVDGIYQLVAGLEGLGTEANPYVINTVEELIFFRDSVNAGETKYNAEGVYVALGADIDMADVDWSVNIGDDCNKTFDGIFDGQGHTIKNLNSTETAAKADGYICTGLFGAIYGSAVVKNLTIENVNINTGDYAGDNIGAVVGFAYNCTGSIENVKVAGKVRIEAEKASSVGTIVGYAYGGTLTVKDCAVDAGNRSYVAGKSQVGGIIGYAGGKANIEGCSAENLDIEGTGLVGGIAGILCGGTATNNTVKDVDLTVTGEMWQNSAAIVAGTISVPSKVVGTTYESVTTNRESTDVLVGSEYVKKPTEPVREVQASVNDVYYVTLEEAIAAAQEGETVVLARDIDVTSTITIAKDKTVTLDLNGKTITGTDNNTTGNFYLIDNKGDLTVVGDGKITLTANTDRGTNNSSVVIATNPGGKLTVESGTIEHLGGTYMAYALDNLTNGKGTSAETIINGGTIKSTYRAVRQFLNGVEATNVLTINGGVIEGANKAVFFQDPSKNANSGTLTIGENATVKGGVYLFVTAGSTEWPVTVSIAEKALVEGSVETKNVPLGYTVEVTNGVYGVRNGLAGTGTETDPYLISNIDELIFFRDSVNAGETKYNAPGVYVELTEDIDLASVENWAPIGTFDYSFDGNFDGQGHKIMNLKMSDNTAASGEAYLGFFGVTANNVIENLVIENVTISSNGQIVAAAIAYPYYTEVKNITVCGDIAIKGGNYTAGVLGYTRLCTKASELTVSGNAGSYITGDKTVGGVIADIQMNKGLVADYSNFNVSGVTITGNMHVGGIAGIIAGQTVNGVSVKNVTLNCSDARVGTVAGSLGATSTITNATVENVTGATTVIGGTFDTGAKVEAKIGDKYYATLEAAHAAANAGDTITLLAPVVVAAGETLEINKDVNITYTSDVEGEDMITVRGTLNVASGKITYINNSNGSNVTVSTISAEPGSVVNVTGGAIENKSVKADGSSSYPYAIDVLTNGNMGDVTVNISGGTVYSDYMAIRQFNNSTTCKNTLNITNGNVYGGKRAVQVHLDNNSAYTNISGGVIEAGADGYALCFLTTSENLAVTGGKFIGHVWYSGTDGFISGGTFSEAVEAEYCAENFFPMQNADGTYGVREGLAGEGTEANPYLISNIDELIFFRDSVNAGKTTYNADGVYVALSEDIDMTGVDWSVNIGDDCNNTFDGIFDGKGYTIKNLSSTETAQKSDGYICTGLFGAIGGSAVVKNFTIENVTIDTGNYTGNNVAAVVGFAYSAKGTIESVKVTGNINIDAEKADGTGAVVGYAYGGNLTVKDCSVIGADDSEINGQAYVGGVIGYAGGKTTVEDCTVENIAVNATSCAAGGIAGILLAGGEVADVTVKNVDLTTAHANWKNSAAIVVGTTTGTITVAGTAYEAVTANGAATTAIVGSEHKDKPTEPVKYVQAMIGNKYYVTLEAAIAAATAGDTIKLASDIAISDAITIGKAVNVDTNNHVAEVEFVLAVAGATVTGPADLNVASGVENNAVAYANGKYSLTNAVAKIGDVYYATVAEALEAANANETVVMVADSEEGNIMVPASVTLDLNGHVLTADYVASFGQVTDSTDGRGVLKVVSNRVYLMANNAKLPLYDGAATGYRFFTGEVVLSLKDWDSSDKARFGYRILFNNKEAYKLLSAADSGVSLDAKLTWDGVLAPAWYTFSEGSITTYGSKAYAKQPTADSGTAIVLNIVSGVDALRDKGVESINSVGVVKSATGVTLSSSLTEYAL